MRLAVLDDYQGYSANFAGWSSVPDVTVVPFRDHVYDKDELIARLSDFDAIMRIRERTAFPREVLECLPRLKLILATGMRNAGSLDLAAADELGINVSATDALHQTTVEIAWALMLSLARRIPQEVASLRAGGWQVGLGWGLSGKTLGIVGLGAMGIPVARIGHCFGMHVVAWSPNLTPERTKPHGVDCVSKKELFGRSDIVSIHIPLSSATHGLITKDDIGCMKPSSYLVNTSRAAIVDQDALLTALNSGTIAGAGFDVHDVEPLPLSHPYRHMANVMATPHIGFVTEENYRLFYEASLKNLQAYLAGSPTNLITAERPFLADSQVGLNPRQFPTA